MTRTRTQVARNWIVLIVVLASVAVASVATVITLHDVLSPVNAPYHDALMGR